MACLVFEHIDDVYGAIDEVARVLRPGGRFSFFLNHPLLQTPGSGWISDHTIDPPESYWRIGPYLVEQDSVEQVERGVFIRFLHRPLSVYLNALTDAGLDPGTHGRAGPAGGLPGSGGGVRRGVGDSRVCCISVCADRRLRVSEPPDRPAVTHRLVGPRSRALAIGGH